MFQDFNDIIIGNFDGNYSRNSSLRKCQAERSRSFKLKKNPGTIWSLI